MIFAILLQLITVMIFWLLGKAVLWILPIVSDMSCEVI